MKMVQTGLLFLVFYFGVIVRSEYTKNIDINCNINEWRCFNKQQCIPAGYRCDVYVDCADGSDEINCDKSTTKSTTKPTNKSTTLFATKSTSKFTIKPTSKLNTTIKPMTTKPNGPKKCGLPAIQPISSNSRIVGGVPAKPHSWPWQVSLQYESKHICGGSIINETMIITAAHCFSGSQKADWTVVAGENTFSTTTDGETQTRNIKDLIIHANYTSTDNDIAILVLSSPLVLNDNILPICLHNEKVIQGKNCYATGWGKSIDDNFSGREDKLRQARLPIINQSICVTLKFYEKVNSTQLCAGYLAGGTSVCRMDSGGPFVCQQSDKKWYLDGITSWGIGCAVKNQPGVFTRVFSYIDWIVEKTGFKL